MPPVKEYGATVTRRGRITIPADIRRLLDLKPGDQVRFIVRDNQIQLAAKSFTVETAFGSVPSIPGRAADIDFQRQIDEAKDEHAERLIRKMSQL